MRPLLDHLDDLPFPSVLHSTSSLDIYYDRPESSSLYTFTEADLIDLAKFYSGLEYPGLEIADAIANTPDGALVFKNIESATRPPLLPFAVSNLFYVPSARKYIDPYDVYREVRERRLSFAAHDEEVNLESEVDLDWRVFTDNAVLLSRYEFTEDDASRALVALSKRVDAPGRFAEDPQAEQRRLLIELFEGRNPKAGFHFLRRVGYVDLHWPELSAMYGVSHSKDHHPEGNVWEHTLETFHYRKDTDLALSLGLLFHDSGKPFAQRNEGRMFDRHSQIGAGIATKFMRRLGFSEPIVSDATFLVRQHMLPGLIHDFPTYRTESVLRSLLFPMLLELYRCDLSSTYRGPDGYYRACRVYRSYLKNVSNPFRTSDGKKIIKRYVAG